MSDLIARQPQQGDTLTEILQFGKLMQNAGADPKSIARAIAKRAAAAKKNIKRY